MTHTVFNQFQRRLGNEQRPLFNECFCENNLDKRRFELKDLSTNGELKNIDLILYRSGLGHKDYAKKTMG